MSDQPQTTEAAAAAFEAGPPESSIQQQAVGQRPAWRRDRMVWLALLLLLLMGWEALATITQHVGAASEADWEQAVKLLDEAQRQVGGGKVGSTPVSHDPVLFAPLWVAPVGRHHFARFISVDRQALSDVDRYPRVWQLSVRGARHPWLAGREPKRTWEVGGVTLALFAADKPAKVLFDFYERLGEATVDRAGASPAACRKTSVLRPGRSPAPRFTCDARRRWNWVGQHLAEVGHQPYRCIFAHPVDDHRMRVAFNNVPLGDQLVVYTGIDDFENRKKSQSDVVLKVFVNDKPLATITHENSWPWHRTVVGTVASSGKRARVRFEISAEVAFARTFCFAADARQTDGSSAIAGSSAEGKAR